MKKIIYSVVLLFLSFNLGHANMGSKHYKEIETQSKKLMDEEKFQAALDFINKNSSTLKDPLDQALILTKILQIETGLHDYETAVNHFRSQPWPKEIRAHALLNIFSGYSLQNYASAYSYEIRKRNKIDSKVKKDLKTWTIEEIYIEAVQNYNDVWKVREKLNELPRTELSDFITPNNYPKGIRDTLRDSFSYIFSGLLNDSSGWTPKESNEIYTISLPKLLNGEFAANFSLTSDAFHPVEKIAFVLHDLQKWHLQNKKLGAALEAQIKLLRILYDRYTADKDQELIRNHLEKILKKYESDPWYSMGMAKLSEFWKEKDSLSNSHINALKFAKLGLNKFPKSFGATLCTDFINQIEVPGLSLEAMSVDGEGKKSIGINYKNITKVHFFSFPFDIKKFMTESKDHNPDFYYIKSSEIVKEKPAHTWSMEMPSTTDYKTHKAYNIPPKHKPGFYIVVASMDPTLKSEANIIQGNFMTFSNLVMSHKIDQYKGTVEFEINNGNDGSFAKNIELEIYQYEYKNNKPKTTFRKKIATDKNGKVIFDLDTLRKLQNLLSGENGGNFFAIAQEKEHFAFQKFDLYQYNSRHNLSTQNIVYTDRAIYRPQQKIMWKTIFYQNTKNVGEYKLLTKSTHEVKLFDLNGQLVESKKIQTDEFGAAWGEFTIPTGKALGRWFIQSDGGSHYVQVEEYKRPTFELSWKPETTPFKLNKKVELIGEAKYYFGAPLTSGKAKYRVQREIVFPWWCFWGYWNYSQYQTPQILESKEAKIESDGTFKISFLPQADDRFKDDDIKYTYIVEADVTDDGGETRSSTKYIFLGHSSIEPKLQISSSFFIENTENEIKLNRLTLNGVPSPGKGSWKLIKLQEAKEVLMPADQIIPEALNKMQPDILKFPDDKKQSRWNSNYNWQAIIRNWNAEKQIKEDKIETDKNGSASIKLPKLNAGTYRLIYETQDDFGVDVKTQVEFFVTNKNYKPSLPGLFLVDKSIGKVGEQIQLWIPSGYKNQELVLEVFQDQKLIDFKKLNSTSDELLIAWPLKESSRGGISFTVRLMHDYQTLVFHQDIYIPWDNKEIGIEFKTFREKLKPGQDEEWTIKLTGPKKEKLKKASVQLLAYLYDRSLDQLAPHRSESVLSLYPNRSGFNLPEIGLGQAISTHIPFSFYIPTHFSHPYEDRPYFYANYGIGGPGRRGGGHHYSKSSKGMADMAVAPSAASFEMMAESSDDGAKVAGGLGVAKAKKEASPEPSSAPAPVTSKKEEPVQIRSQFSETSFFYPNLTNKDDGTIDIKFKVPDSVTSWTLWLQGFTKDLMSASASKQIQTVKELIIRPYLPRFLREGDNASLRFVLNNTSDQKLSGKINIDLLEEDKKSDASSRFSVKPTELKNISFSIEKGKSFVHTINLKTPPGLGSLTIKAVAQSENHSDGELRTLPILPGRFHLAQSKFVTLKDKDSKKLEFKELSSDKDKTRINEKMVVQIDAQLFYSVLTSLPYLINYPYECVEQTLNKFISTGIMSSIYNQFPAIDKMAKEMSSRNTQLENFESEDPNRKMALEETPWLNEAKGGNNDSDQLINVLNSRVAKITRDESLFKLEKAQSYDGGFPWFSGGRSSHYMTIYIVYGFSKAMEFGVEVPKPMIQKAFRFLHHYYLNDLVKDCMRHDSCWETITFLNYVLSNYPADYIDKDIFTLAERKTMLDFSFKHWKAHSPYLKGYLALTLHRHKRAQEAKLVWDSVMDSAKYNQEEGTHWAREDRSWLWYNDTIESHAFALRTLMELGSDNEKRDGLVQWLFLNKKLNHWKSTRATSEVIYSLTHYLSKTKQLGKNEDVTIKIGSEKPIQMHFSPDSYTGKKNQIVYEGDKINSKLMPITVEKNTTGFMFASANWQFSTEELPKESVGDFLSVKRKFFVIEQSKKGTILKPLAEGNPVHVGDEVEVHLSLTAKSPVGYVHLRDPRGAGFEPADTTSKHKWDLRIYWYEEIRDSATNFFFEQLPQGEYNFKYRIRAATTGEFKVSPATVQPMYAPEFSAYSDGIRLEIKN